MIESYRATIGEIVQYRSGRTWYAAIVLAVVSDGHEATLRILSPSGAADDLTIVASPGSASGQWRPLRDG